MLLSFPPVAISPRGYVSLGAIMHTQDTKFEWPDIQCISVKPLSGLSREEERREGNKVSAQVPLWEQVVKNYMSDNYKRRQ